MRYYQSFPTAIPRKEAGSPRVTHPSATKIKQNSDESFIRDISVRLACVRHAASVHPEPGSNSHVKCCSSQPDLNVSIKDFDQIVWPSAYRCTAVLFCFRISFVLKISLIIKESSGLHFCSAVAEFSNLPATTQRFWLSLFDLEGSSDLSVVPAWQVSAPVEQLWYHTTICLRCQQLF